MKILIAYTSKYGTVRTCVLRLCEQLHGLDVTVADLEQETPDPQDFDTVVFGSSVYFGKLRPAARQFLKQYANVLAKKHLALFLCCGLTEEYEYYREKLFSQALRNAAFQTLYFGGSLNSEGRSFGDRLLLRAMRSKLMEEAIDNSEYIVSLPGILPENIDKLATCLRKVFADGGWDEKK